MSCRRVWQSVVPDSTISTTERASGFGQHSLPFDRLPARIRPPNLTTARLCTSFSRPPRYPLSPAVPPSPRRVAHTSHTLPALTASLPSRASHYLALGHPPPVRVQTVPRARRRVKGDYGSTKFLRRRRVSYEFQAAHQSLERVCSQPLSSCTPRRLNPSSPWTARPETSPPHHLTASKYRPFCKSDGRPSRYLTSLCRVWRAESRRVHVACAYAGHLGVSLMAADDISPCRWPNTSLLPTHLVENGSQAVFQSTSLSNPALLYGQDTGGTCPRMPASEAEY